MYNVARDNGAGNIKLLDQPVFNSIQPRTRFQLHTNEAGRIYYEVKQIGDATYPLAKNRDFVIPRADRLLFEQEVLFRPSAKFRNANRLAYCLNDLFVPWDTVSSDGLIALEGTPPFTINLSIKNLAAGETYTTSVEVSGMSWRIDLPNYTFKNIGPYLVTIDSVQDVSRCDQTMPDPLYRSIWADVVETATIVPFERREHFCEGEVSQFQLEGNPPWTIGYV
jgi:nucleoporin POM152